MRQSKLTDKQIARGKVIRSGVEGRPATEVPIEYLSEQRPTLTDEEGHKVVIVDWNAETQQLVVNNPKNYMPVFAVEPRYGSTIYLGPALSQWAQLRQFARSLTKGGPYTVQGSNGEIEISNSKANKKPLHTYTYAGGSGELLEYRIDTKFSIKTVEASKSTDINPDNQDLETEIVQDISNTDASTVDGVVQWDSYRKSPYLPNNRADALRMEVARPRSPGLTTGQAGVRSSINTKLVEAVLDGKSITAPGIARIKHLPGTSSENAYSSEQVAKEVEARRYVVTQSDIDSYLATVIEYFNQLKVQAKSIEDIKEFAKLADNLPDFLIRKTVWIERQVKPHQWNSSDGVSGINPGATAGSTTLSWTQGFKTLKDDPSIVIKPSTGGQGRYLGYDAHKLESVTILQQKAIEIPISGRRILSLPGVQNSSTLMGNDITKTTTAQIGMEVTVLGNPGLHKNQILTLRNISTRYSGDYYTKKVTHTISNTDGYKVTAICEQKTVPISTVTISAKVKTNEILKQINDLNQEVPMGREPSYNEWATGTNITATVTNHREDLLAPDNDNSYLYIQDENNPNQYQKYSSDMDFSGGKVSNEALNRE